MMIKNVAPVRNLMRIDYFWQADEQNNFFISAAIFQSQFFLDRQDRERRDISFNFRWW